MWEEFSLNDFMPGLYSSVKLKWHFFVSAKNIQACLKLTVNTVFVKWISWVTGLFSFCNPCETRANKP